MNILVDTSVIVELDRGNALVQTLLKTLLKKNISLLISTITVSEIITGTYLTQDPKHSLQTAKEILNQFSWISFDGHIAEKTGQLLAYLIANKKIIEYQDVAIAATFLQTGCDYLLTLNTKHFTQIPRLSSKVFTPESFKKTKRY